MDADHLFVAEMRELEQRVLSSNEYDTLMIAASLRKLLLDAHPLVHLVNSTRTHKLRFVANCQPEDAASLRAKLARTGAFVWARQDGFDPHTARAGTLPPAELNLRGLLACVVVMWRGYEVTVGELIAYVAHIAGAVHVGKPRTAKEIALVDMAQRTRAGEATPVVAQLQAIGRVVLRGLAPLRETVSRDLADRGVVAAAAPTQIVGLSAKVFLADLERLGFAYPISRRAAGGAAALDAVERWRFDDLALYSIVIACEADRVRLLTASVHAIKDDVDLVAFEARAAAGLASIATLTGICQEPERAGTWVRTNIGQPSATLNLGGTFFEIDATTTVPGRQYRLTIAAAGARPRTTA
jgi:hypothetical protein